jgi:hypothetical protein
VDVVDKDDGSYVPIKRGRRPSRNWDLWLQPGRVVRLYEGRDFTCKASSLRPQVYTAATSRGGQANVGLTQEGGKAVLIIEYIGPEEFRRRQEQPMPESAPIDSPDYEPLTNDRIEELYRELHPEEEETEEIAELRRRASQIDFDDLPIGKRKWGPPE